MATKVIRLESDCCDILRKYAPEPASFTDGIREMERRITNRVQPGQMSFTTASAMATGNASAWYPVLEDGMSPEYWKRLSREIETVVGSYAGGKV